MSRGHLVGEVLGSGEVEDGGLGVGAGGDDRGADLLAVGEGDPDDPAVADVDRGDLGAGADLAPAASAERAIAWLIAPMPPITWPQPPEIPSISPSAWWSRL